MALRGIHAMRSWRVLALAALVLAGAVPLLPLVAKNWQHSGRPWLRALGRVLAPFALFAAFDVSLLGGGGIALMRFRLEGIIAAACALGFLMLQPVGILLALRVAREGEATPTGPSAGVSAGRRVGMDRRLDPER